MLLCVNRYREGSDIPNLDCGIYLDAVKNRSILVSMQTSGRVIRPDEIGIKTHGVMIDMFISRKGLTVNHLTVDKIFQYYDQIINLADDINDLKQDNDEKYQTYIKYRELLLKTNYDKVSDEINIQIDPKKKIKIKIQLINNKIDWTMVKDLLEIQIMEKCQIDNYFLLKANFKIICQKINVDKLNPKNWDKWYQKISQKYNGLIDHIQIRGAKYCHYWEKYNWFTSLGIAKNFYLIIDELAKHLPKKCKMNCIEDYHEIAKNDNKMPLDFGEYYDITEKNFIKKINNLKQSVKNKKIINHIFN